MRNRVLGHAVASFFLLFSGAGHAAVEVTGGVESGRFIDGVNLTDNRPSTFLSAEWSAYNGAFAGLSCFLSEQSDRVIIQRGCDAQLGWFVPVNERHAFTFAISRHDYSSPRLTEWEYTDASARWHIGKTASLGVRVSDSLLGQDIASATLFSEFSYAVTERVGLGLELGHASLESNLKTDSLMYALARVEYGFERWTVKVKALLRDSNFEDFSRIDNDRSDIGVTVQYRFY